MTMFIKSYTVSNRLAISTEQDGVETDRTVYSEAGFRADVMLYSNERFKAKGSPTSMHLSIVVDVDSLPDMNSAQTRDWLRDQLVEMLADRPAED